MCDAIWISNHGGIKLDSVAATIDILSDVKNVVGLKVAIFIDGGVRTGNDVFKCLALGADYVFLGRPVQLGEGVPLSVLGPLGGNFLLL